jgi:hypothetical protein
MNTVKKNQPTVADDILEGRIIWHELCHAAKSGLIERVIQNHEELGVEKRNTIEKLRWLKVCRSKPGSYMWMLVARLLETYGFEKAGRELAQAKEDVTIQAKHFLVMVGMDRANLVGPVLLRKVKGMMLEDALGL